MNGSHGDKPSDMYAPANPGSYDLQTGTLLGDYRILRPLGRGGMGQVYLAENRVSGKKIALKLLPARSMLGDGFLDRFRIESRVMSDLHHPNIVQVLHAGEDQGRYYLTMEYIEGPEGDAQTLEDRLKVEGSRLKEEEIKNIALQLLDALIYAHGKGIIHRDLKPANILLSRTLNSEHPKPNPEHHVFVSDFGLAKVVGDDFVSAMVKKSISVSMGRSIGEDPTQKPRYEGTSTGALLGTYDYMSPEQKAGAAVTEQSDLYAFGVILYRMLTGRKPEGRFKLPSAYGCNQAWDSIVEKCLEPDFRDRCATAAEVRKDVERMWKEWPQKARKTEKKRGWLAVAAGVVLALVGIAVIFHRSVERDKPLAKKKDEIVIPPMMTNEIKPQPSVNLAKALEAKVDAEMVWKRLERRDLADTELVGRQDEIFRALTIGQQAFDRDAHDIAVARYREVTNGVAEVENLLIQRQSAIWEKELSAYARRRSYEAGAEADAPVSWLMARTVEDRAAQLFVAVDYASAAREWQSAAAHYVKAEAEAKSVQSYREAKSAYEAVAADVDQNQLQKYAATAWSEAQQQAAQGAALAADPSTGITAYQAALGTLLRAVAEAEDGLKSFYAYREAKSAYEAVAAGVVLGLLEQYAAAGLKEAQQQAERGEALAADPSSGVTAYQVALATLNRAVEEASRLATPSVLFMVTAGGRSVTASISDGSRTWRAGEKIPLVESNNYAFTISYETTDSGPRWQAQQVSLAVDWTGERRQTVKLEEVFNPTAGNMLGMAFVEVASGSFSMGSNSGRIDEKPVRTIRISYVFWVGKYEVTQREYRQLMGNNPSHFKSDELPVEQVSWHDAVKFCEDLTKYEREAGRLPATLVYRLPTEAEWEFVARGGKISRGYTYSGGNDLDAVGWHRSNSRGKTQPVGRKQANELGVHDMSGNVWEWVHDWYQNSYSGLSTRDPVGPANGSGRVYRGGSWYRDEFRCRVTDRINITPTRTANYLGFRVVLGPPL